jgi:DMSO/TMAO reductase YedYZ molybdopterin-dependent catalytic subunit
MKNRMDEKQMSPHGITFGTVTALVMMILLIAAATLGCAAPAIPGPSGSETATTAASTVSGPTESGTATTLAGTSNTESPVPSSTDDPDAVSGATKSRFRSGEVQNYQGKNLSPAIGPSDNSISGVQQVDIEKYVLAIDGAVDKAQSLKYDEVIALTPYERLITLHCVTGWDATILWKGVLLDDLIAMAGAKPEAVTVIFHSVDGYTTSLPLAIIREKQLILAYSSNGLDLPPEMGYPFIVVAEEKFGYKWARWVTGIELSEDADYMGYWEQRGYDNTADIGK